MNGMVERRNQQDYWAGRVRFVRLKRKFLPKCEDCLLNVHAQGGTSHGIPKATWKRSVSRHSLPFTVVGDLDVLLCDLHKTEWLTWTPGQQVLA